MSKEQTDWVMVPRETLNAIRLYVDDCLMNRYIDAAAMGNLYAARDEIDRLTAASPSPAGGVQGVKVKPLDDDAIMALIKECFPWKTHGNIYDALTIEKSPPMFPQATYDVPNYLAERFVRAVEQRILSALSSQAQTTGGVE